MTSKEFVKQHFPNAKAERQVEGNVIGLQRVYWVIRPNINSMYIASGNSESNAWVNAKNNIINSK